MVRKIDRLQHKHLRALSAAAYPEETYWTLARGRAGAYSDALETEKDLEAVLADKVFTPPDTELTEWFMVDRLVRSRLAAIDVRNYLIGRFNDKILCRWCELNGWSPVRVAFGPVHWSRGDWLDLQDAYTKGKAAFSDVQAAVEAERQA